VTCRRLTASLAALTSLAGAAHVALGASGDPQKRLVAADGRLAKGVLLTRADLGARTWKSVPGAATTLSNCGIIRRLQPVESGLVETGAANGPLFTNKAAQALTQTVRVFATPKQANEAWSRTATKNLVICMEQQVENLSTMGAPVSVTDWRPLKLPKATDHAAAYRVTATASAGKNKSNVYFDLILLGQSRTITKLIFSALGKPVSTAYEARLATDLSQRLRATSTLWVPQTRFAITLPGLDACGPAFALRFASSRSIEPRSAAARCFRRALPRPIGCLFESRDACYAASSYS